MKLEVYKIDGSLSGDEVLLPADVFGVKPNEHAVWLAVNAEMSNRRQGNAQVKTRSAVSGGGRKPWPQKGRGTARAGSIRSPIWVGGGRAFGPSKRSYSKKLNKKIKRLARRSVLSLKAKDEKIKIIEDFDFKSPTTKKMEGILTKLNLASGRTLLITQKHQKTLWLSSRNLKNLDMQEAQQFSTRDILYSEYLVIQKSALKKIKEGLIK